MRTDCLGMEIMIIFLRGTDVWFRTSVSAFYTRSDRMEFGSDREVRHGNNEERGGETLSMCVICPLYYIYVVGLFFDQTVFFFECGNP